MAFLLSSSPFSVPPAAGKHDMMRQNVVKVTDITNTNDTFKTIYRDRRDGTRKLNSKTHIVFDKLENHHHRVSHESNNNFVVAYKWTGVIPFNKCLLKCTTIFFFVGAFKFERECKIEYVGFAFSRHIPISCHELPLYLRPAWREQGLWKRHWFEIRKSSTSTPQSRSRGPV